MLNMSNPIVLDTHALLWSLLEPEQLSETIKEKIYLAQQNNELFIASISFFKLLCCNLKKELIFLSL
jgi:PIN domain nuclease of toxin-antitoxin system